MKDISIEYAHIYTNKKIDDEHKLSLNILNKIMKKEKSRDSISLVVMVDDYSFPDPSFDYNSFVSWLTEQGFKPDLVLRESQLIPTCDELLKKINNKKIKAQLIEYIKSKKYPCSLFIASWYLIRLGILNHPLFNNQLTAKKIVNILPISFKPFEEKALEIITSTQFAKYVKNIEYHYLEGRSIVL